jgi:hypothetical protein
MTLSSTHVVISSCGPAAGFASPRGPVGVTSPLVLSMSTPMERAASAPAFPQESDRPGTIRPPQAWSPCQTTIRAVLRQQAAVADWRREEATDCNGGCRPIVPAVSGDGVPPDTRGPHQKDYGPKTAQVDLASGRLCGGGRGLLRPDQSRRWPLGRRFSAAERSPGARARSGRARAHARHRSVSRRPRRRHTPGHRDRENPGERAVDRGQLPGEAAGAPRRIAGGDRPPAIPGAAHPVRGSARAPSAGRRWPTSAGVPTGEREIIPTGRGCHHSWTADQRLRIGACVIAQRARDSGGALGPPASWSRTSSYRAGRPADPCRPSGSGSGARRSRS